MQGTESEPELICKAISLVGSPSGFRVAVCSPMASPMMKSLLSRLMAMNTKDVRRGHGENWFEWNKSGILCDSFILECIDEQANRELNRPYSISFEALEAEWVKNVVRVRAGAELLLAYQPFQSEIREGALNYLVNRDATFIRVLARWKLKEIQEKEGTHGVSASPRAFFRGQV